MKIAFIWYFDRASWVLPHWKDGLRAALDLLDHEIDWYLDEKLPKDEYDFHLIWGDSNCPAIKAVKDFKGRKGICLTTDPWNSTNLQNLDVVFVESEPIYQSVRQFGIRAIKAFGTDTDFFKPKKVKKDIEYFYPATFSPWKRQSSIADLGDKLWCVGTIQPDGESEYNSCIKSGVHVEDGYFPAEKILDYYQRSLNVIIPAIHGSERTVLESMACNILPSVNPENKRAHSYITEFSNSKYEKPRDFILNNYSHKLYAQKLLKGIEN